MTRIESAFLRNHFQADYVEEMGGWPTLHSAVVAARNVLRDPHRFPRADFDTLETVDLEGTCLLLAAPVQYIA